MVKEFEITNLGLMAYFLGIDVKQGMQIWNSHLTNKKYAP
jgi:hypothetical protein